MFDTAIRCKSWFQHVIFRWFTVIIQPSIFSKLPFSKYKKTRQKSHEFRQINQFMQKIKMKYVYQKFNETYFFSNQFVNNCLTLLLPKINVIDLIDISNQLILPMLCYWYLQYTFVFLKDFWPIMEYIISDQLCSFVKIWKYIRLFRIFVKDEMEI